MSENNLPKKEGRGEKPETKKPELPVKEVDGIKKEKVEELSVNGKKSQEKLKQDTEELMDAELINEVLKNNEFEFEDETIKYRVRKPTYEEKQKANELRMSKYLELLRNDKYVLEDDLIKLYKKRGIDIGGMDRQITSITKQKEAYMLKLGDALKNKQVKEAETIKKAIDDLNREIQTLSLKKSNFLEFSIENQVLVTIYTYLTWLVSEKLIEDKWVKVFDSYEDFLKDKTQLINKLTFYGSLIINEELSFNKFEG